MDNAFSNIRLLLVEDDPSLGSILKEYLELKGFTIHLVEDGHKGWEAFQSFHFDLLILDVMLPKKDGFTLAVDIREVNSEIPIIFLTAKSMPEDRIKGLQTGADDYLTKPFSMEELLLRIQAVLRRIRSPTPLGETFRLGQTRFDPNTQELSNEENSQKLTTKESELLKLLCLHQNEVVTREKALQSIWGEDDYFKGRSMDVFITKIRKYLKMEPEVELINVHGTGFKLVVKN